MSREKKVEIISQLKEAVASCNVGVLTDYRGLSASEMTDLRRKLREAGVEYRVVKNTLARFAVKKAGKAYLAGSFEGPVAIAFGYDSVTEPARVLIDYIKSTKSVLSIKGGFLDERFLTPADITTLSKLPSRDILLSQVLAGMQSPIVSLLNCLNSPLRGFMAVLQARIKQLEEA